MTIRYSDNGLWVQKAGNEYTLGLSIKGQDDLGEVMFVDLTDTAATIEKNETLIGVEAAKAVTELTAPFAGKLVRKNEGLSENPEALNSTNYSENWIAVLSNVDETEFNALSEKEPQIG
ncbi:glycine cleavage system protein H [Carnobacterium divergens]|uniref:Lipoyl-binding domain-containing protein n=1 Tax=Carnobacterium divergens DSM 20623 TaxID=1449336 RepID=A0A0R2HYE2_CARDV|nr:glycine cleavage system protein H [Carnobacterium divergens]KRN57791.1 hypothetical protein IV74_GL001046 [Carnobacterium divergens DSM 20623]MDO0874422.1 glycine cleavage system protein H [Carnobacterium divergens]SUX21858.1 Octanoyl/lipoyl carrier protein [Carnobacterium divergens]